MLRTCATAVLCWFAEAPGRMGRVLLRSETGVVDALVYWCAIAWCGYLVITPDAGFVSAAHATILAVKDLWVFPAVAAVLLTPLGWVCHWRWVHHLARWYVALWWIFIFFCTLILLPGVIPFWMIALGLAGVSAWLLVREAAEEIIRDQQTG